VLNTAWHYFKEKGNGHIVAVTSIAAARGNKAAPAYNASKAFQSNYLEALRVMSKYEKNKIVITELIPGFIDTAMGKGDRMFWIATVDKAARQSKRAIDKKRMRAFITKRWWLIYRILRLLPVFIYDPFINGSWKLNRKR
jgi:short-subunit dehydrogenase